MFFLKEIPEYLGFGSPEDSLASCYGLTPKPPKKDILKYMTNTNKVTLRNSQADKYLKLLLFYSSCDLVVFSIMYIQKIQSENLFSHTRWRTIQFPLMNHRLEILVLLVADF